MSVRFLSDCFLTIDETDFSANSAKVAINQSAAVLDVTTFGNTSKANLGGLKEWTMAIEMLADESVTGVLQSKLGTVVTVEVRASSDDVAETNPSYSGSGVLNEYTPLDADVGNEQRITLTITGSGDLTRVTAAV